MTFSGATVKTIDHDEIREWIEEHNGSPAKLAGRILRGDNLRIDFENGTTGEELEKVTWEEFFDIFEEEGLVFKYEQHSPENDDKRPNKQKFEILDEERGAMQDELGTELDEPEIRDNTKETMGGRQDWRSTNTAEKDDSLRDEQDES